MSFLYVTLVTEGALIIFFPDKKRQGALIGAGALNGANTVCRILVSWRFPLASGRETVVLKY